MLIEYKKKAVSQLSETAVAGVATAFNRINHLF
jgi:hypothetical protein